MTVVDVLVNAVIIIGFFAALAGAVIITARILDDWIGR